MKRLAIIALLCFTGLSCDVNDYCLNCEQLEDGGTGDGGDGDSGDDGNPGDGSACTNTGPEVCDDEDNDCDGAVDEQLGTPIGDACDNTVGECQGGVKICVAGTIRCNKPPAAEVCDNKDNDCDGVVDDGDPGGGAKCGTDNGECVAGTLHCMAGAIACVGAVGGTQPPFGVPEICNGKDDNCDNLIDNGAPVPATACDGNPDLGECDKGAPTCIGGAVVCVGQSGPSPELCDMLDQDCDGNPTNGFDLQHDPTNCGMCGHVCNLPNAVEACTPIAGVATCVVAGCNATFHDNNNIDADGCEFGPCTKNGNEVCNNADDDCDGLKDMADPDLVVPPVNTMCRTQGECAALTTVVCDGTAGGFRCVYGDPDVQQMNGVIQQETRCDGLDNDCDGIVDEGQPGLGGACTKGQGACATTGTLICDPNNLDGAAICDAATPGAGTPEVCDGKDNDCNGVVDDNGASGNLPGQAWVPIVGGVEMMQYEASHPDATATNPGVLATHACSRPGAQPWTNITYPQALAVCNGMGARLCTEAEWQSTCLPDAAWPVAASTLTTNIDDFRFVEAEQMFLNVAQGGRAWLAIAPASFNGTTAMQVPDTGFAQTSAASALAQSPRMDYRFDLAGSTTYTPWLRMRTPAATSVAPQLRAATAPVTGTSVMSPATTEVGDLVVVSTLTGNVNNPAHAVTGGFTLIASAVNDDGTNDARLSIAYRVATSAGAVAYAAFTANGGTTLSGLHVLRAGTYDLATLSSTATQSTDTSAPNPPNVGPLAQASLVFATGGWNYAASATTAVTMPGTFTEVYQLAGAATLELAVAQATAAQGTSVNPAAFGDNTSPENTVAVTWAIGGSTSRSVWVGLGPTNPGNAHPTPVSTTADGQWMWIAGPPLTSGAAGTHTFSIYLREDGVMVDMIALARQGATSPTFENVWAYETSPRVAQPLVCNGDEVDTAPAVAIAASPAGATAAGTTATFTTAAPHRLAVGSAVTVAGVANAAYNGTWTVLTTPSPTQFTVTIVAANPGASGGGTANGDQDDMLATAWNPACHAEHGANDVFDLSGNAKEWTAARAPNQNPLRGGSANNAVNGLTCKLSFTLADNTFFFPNVGFRCCRD